MAWPDCHELWGYWQETPPSHVSLACLAVGMRCMKLPGSAAGPSASADGSTEAELEAFDRAVNGE